MIRWVVGVAAVTLVVAPAAAQRQDVRAFAVRPDVAVRMYNLVGTTRITGWERDSIVVVATIPRGGGSLFGGGGGAVAKLGIEGQDPSLTGPGSTLEVKVPRNARIWVKSASAGVEVVNVAGEVEVSSITGPIRLEGSPRVSTLETIDGDVAITGQVTVLRVRTGAGSVQVSGARGDITVSTVQGPVTVESDQLIGARLETVSGRIEVRSGVTPDGSLEIESHEGEVRLTLPGVIDARFDLATVKGKLDVVMPGRPAVPQGDRTARFTVGTKASFGRGAGIMVRTFSGVIRVDSNPQGR